MIKFLKRNFKMPKQLQSWLFCKKGWVNILFFLGTCGILTVTLLFFKLQDQKVEAHPGEDFLVYEENLPDVLKEKLPIFQENTLIPVSSPSNPEPERTKRMEIILTGYSSTEDQTDSSPFITASGTWVKEGIIAANFLPFGTKIKFPSIYGDKIFVVEDRMHPKNYNRVDIWFPSRWQALNLGIIKTYIEILEG